MPAPFPDAFSLVGMAIEKIGEHDIRYNCDTLEMAEALRYLLQARELLRVNPHPDWQACDIDECTICAVRDCPYDEPLHYHHDGCPSCDTVGEGFHVDVP